MKHIQFKEFTHGENSQLQHLNFCAGGNLSRSSGRRRIALREKHCNIIQHNFIVKLKNFCIDLGNGNFNRETFEGLSNHLNLYKKNVDLLDYSFRDERQRAHYLKQFIQNNLPFRYLKMYHYNMNLIK